jgi:hypothetical protein
MGKLLTSHRSTTYPCYLPVLGDSAGAGRIRLTHGKSSSFMQMRNGLTFFAGIDRGNMLYLCLLL